MNWKKEEKTKEHISEVHAKLQTDPKKDTELTKHTEENEKFQEELEAKFFDENEVNLLLKQKELDTLTMALETFETHKSNMYDSFKTDEAMKAAKWLKEKLAKKGYEV